MSQGMSEKQVSFGVHHLPVLILAIVVLLLGASLVLEYGLGQIPCALCLAQRYSLAALLMWWGSATLFRRGRLSLKLCYFIGAVMAMILTSFAVLQYLEQQSPKQELGFCTAGKTVLDSVWLNPMMPKTLSSCSEAPLPGSDWPIMLWLIGLYSALVILHWYGFLYWRARRDQS